ncbi:LAFA_0C06722g1_1 [Lachancea sp. 'fantastica']|nr:LAFA_0C06722g1_1 [Lachancea sp. 'fantastica']
MAAPANLFPGLNEVSDVLEEMPLEVSRYMTLLREIDAKCIHTVPELNGTIHQFLHEESGAESLQNMNGLFQELMPSLEEKMHVSALAYESLSRLTARLELAYEVAIKNTEIPPKIRLGNDDHPAMHLHYELMAKIDSKTNSKSSQALKSESRREAMAARRTGPQGTISHPETGSTGHGGANSGEITTDGNVANNGPSSHYETPVASDSRRKRTVGATGSSNSNVPGPASAGAATAAGAHHNHHHHHQSHLGTANQGSASQQGLSRNAGGGGGAAGASELKRRKRKPHTKDDYSQRSKTNEYGEALYCYCHQVAYGEMVGCDGDNCILEWFHLPCIGLETLPKGKWYCNDCK